MRCDNPLYLTRWKISTCMSDSVHYPEAHNILVSLWFPEELLLDDLWRQMYHLLLMLSSSKSVCIFQYFSKCSRKCLLMMTVAPHLFSTHAKTIWKYFWHFAEILHFKTWCLKIWAHPPPWDPELFSEESLSCVDQGPGRACLSIYLAFPCHPTFVSRHRFSFHLFLQSRHNTLNCDRTQVGIIFN